MPRKSIGETAMTDAERQARYRAARAAGKPVIRVRRAARSSRPGPALDRPRRRPRGSTDLSMPPGSKACRTTCETARSPRHYRRSAIWISPNFRRSSRRAASAETDRSRLGGLHRWVHRNPRAPLRQPLDGHSASRGSPYGLPAQADHAGGQFWTPIGGQYSTPIDSRLRACSLPPPSCPTNPRRCS